MTIVLTLRRTKQDFFALTLRVSSEMRDALDRLAIEQRVSRGHIVREAIRAHYGTESLRMHPASLNPDLAAHAPPLQTLGASHPVGASHGR